MSAFTPTDLVQLPRMGVAAASPLGRQVLAAAAAQKPFPKGAVKALATLTAAHAALQSAMVDQFGNATDVDPETEPVVQELDRTLDNCWGGLDDRLFGMSKLPADTAGAAEAAALRKRLFPQGLSFLKLRYPLEWSESQMRLDLIARDGLEGPIAELAGKPFLPAVVAAHAAYGKAIGMAGPLPGAAAAPLVRGALDAFANALRVYVIKVMGSVDDDVPDSQQVADTLLAPLASWDVTPKRAKEEHPPGGAAGGGAPAVAAGGGAADK